MMSTLKIIVQFPGGNRIFYTDLPTNYWDLLSFMQHNVSCNVDNYLKYWIDNENDMVEINNQISYKMFLQLSKNKKLFLATEEKLEQHKTIGIEAQRNKNNELNGECNDKDYKLLTIHTGIECSNCKITPIVGFRYKCQHCEDYDLCMKCESDYVHSNHKMLRLPEEFLKSTKKRKKRSKANVSPDETNEDISKYDSEDENKKEKVTVEVENDNQLKIRKDSIKDNLHYENKNYDLPKEKVENDYLKTTTDIVKNELKHENKNDIKEKVENVNLLNESNIVENVNYDEIQKSNENLKNNCTLSIQSNFSQYNLNKTCENHLEKDVLEAIRRRKLEQLSFDDNTYTKMSTQMSENIRETPSEQIDSWEITKYVILFIVIIWVSSLFSKPSIG